jgi:hypothetical protein
MADRTVATDEQYAELLAQYPAPNELVRVSVQPGEVIIRNPSEVEHHAFATETWGKEGATGYPVAYRNALIMQCVFPDKGALTAWLKRWPGLPTSAGVMRAIKYLSGEAETLEGKK